MTPRTRTIEACNRSVAEQIAQEAWEDMEREFRAAVRELATVTADALYSPLIADLDRKIAERDDA